MLYVLMVQVTSISKLHHCCCDFDYIVRVVRQRGPIFSIAYESVTRYPFDCTITNDDDLSYNRGVFL
jgi:hypothetical protein